MQPIIDSSNYRVSPGAQEALQRTGETAEGFLTRHTSGDWGDVGEEHQALNDRSVPVKARVISAYNLKDGTRLWVVTEEGHSATDLLLPEEYCPEL